MAKAPRVGLFATCLVDAMRPSVGFATAKLLEDAGCIVEVPVGQTCCGQPAYNNGDRETARAMARKLIDLFKNYDYVVAPSGSCAGMLHAHYPALLADDPNYAALALSLSQRSYELVSFLVRVMKVETTHAALAETVTYHDSCSGLRELAIKDEPRLLLQKVEGLDLKELSAAEECCGFGGTFCVKYPEISTKMVDDKLADIESTGAATVLGGDLGCLMNIAGRLKRKGKAVKVRHVAEVLSGMLGGPAIGEERS
ncbi:MAG: (Fe-S)-binding protein [Alphaproteobacteria bacterium]|nr:(Fe-S)-binding protein [Alphaproteobacteria bacterium]